MSSASVERIHRVDAARVWREFAEALGPEATRNAYGPAWPRPVVDEEAVYLFARDGKPAAWASLRPDPVEPWVWYAAGVWPEFQRSGVVHEVRACCLDFARQDWPTKRFLLIEVLDTNPGWRRALDREVFLAVFDDRPSTLRHGGRVNLPGLGATLFYVPIPRL